MASAAAASVSTTKSRSPTASMELRVTPAKPSSAATASRSMWKPAPAMAPEPSGETSARRGASAKPATVALEHLHVGQQVVGEEHGLRRLHVGVPGHDGVARAPGPGSPAPARGPRWPRRWRPAAASARGAGPWPPGRCASGPCAACRPRARSLGEGHLDVEVDVLQGRIPGDGAGLHLGLEGAKPSLMVAASVSVSSPAARSPATWASEPVMSSSASSTSTSIERPKSAAFASGSAEKRPPHAFIGATAAGDVGVSDGDRQLAEHGLRSTSRRNRAARPPSAGAGRRCG